jgi:hypothetical protein
MDAGRFFSRAAGFAAALAFLSPTTTAAPGNSEGEADEKFLQAAKVGTDGPALLEFFRKQTYAKIDHDRIAQLIRRLGDKNFRVRRKATAVLKAIGVPALPALRAAMDAKDIEIRLRVGQCVRAIEGKLRPELTVAAARLITVRRPAKACAVLLAYLPFAPQDLVEDEVVMAILLVRGIGEKVDPVVAAALRDPVPARRAAAALVLGRDGTTEQRAAVRKLLTDRDPKVRFRAAQGLLAVREKAAVPVLVALLADGPLRLARQAEDVLACMAYDEAPTLPLGEEAAQRKKCRDRWAAWWKANADQIYLKKPEVDVVIQYPLRRARRAAQQFIDAYLKGDLVLLKQVTQAPFLMHSRTMSRQQLDAVLARELKRSRQGKKPKFTLLRVVSADEYGRVTSPPRNVLTRLRQSDGHVVYVKVKILGDANEIAFFVRTSSTRARIIGFGSGRDD